jgi:hypothetical protein
MADHPLDIAAKRLATTADRRQIMKGLGAVTAGAVALAGAGRFASAATNNNEQCHDRCRRDCENRNTQHERDQCEERCRSHC